MMEHCARILAVGFDRHQEEPLRTCARRTLQYGRVASVSFLAQLPSEALQEYAAFVIHDRCFDDGVATALDESGVSWKTIVVVEFGSSRAGRMLDLGRRCPLPVAVIGGGIGMDGLAGDLRRLLLHEPAARHLRPVMESILTAEQFSVVDKFLEWEKGPSGVARGLGCSLRSLQRECRLKGLASPRVLAKVARLSRGMAWATQYGACGSEAAWAAGYATSNTYQRAIRAAFFTSPARLLVEWTAKEWLESRLKQVVLRADDPMSPSHSRVSPITHARRAG